MALSISALAMHEGGGLRRDRGDGAAGQEYLPFGAVMRAGPAAKKIEDGGDGFGGQRAIDVARALMRIFGVAFLGQNFLA